MSDIAPPTPAKKRELTELATGTGLPVRPGPELDSPPGTAAGVQNARPEMPTPGQFYAEGRNFIDARREHLSRVGMLPQHVAALRMPELDESPRVVLDIPEPARLGSDEKVPANYAMRKLPKLPGVNATVDEDPEA